MAAHRIVTHLTLVCMSTSKFRFVHKGWNSLVIEGDFRMNKITRKVLKMRTNENRANEICKNQGPGA